MNVFWEKGFAATSLDDVTRETGINKPSLYAAFGDKTSLFLQILERYHDALLGHMRETLAKSGTAREPIRSWFLGFLPACSGATSRGCLSVNTTLEAANLDERIWQAIESFDRRQESLMEAAIRRGVRAGEFAADLDPKAAARHLMATHKGFLLMSRGKPTAARTRRAMEQALSSLDAGAGTVAPD
jgi:TetR/AcrR family transcriptional repressor of nem operon